MYIQHELKKILRCISPVALYIFVQQLIVYITEPHFLSENPVAVTALGAFITIPISIYLRYGDIRKHHAVLWTRRMSPVTYLAIPPAASALAVSLSFFTTLITDYLDYRGYAQTAEMLFGGQLWIQYLCIGMIVPVAEEMIFRGLVQNRIRLYLCSPVKALLISGILFGLFHGNIVQASAAAVCGILIGSIYEKYGCLTAPILFHICFNLTGIFMQHMHLQIPSYSHMILIAVLCMIVVCVDVYIIYKKLIPQPLRMVSNKDV